MKYTLRLIARGIVIGLAVAYVVTLLVEEPTRNPDATVSVRELPPAAGPTPVTNQRGSATEAGSYADAVEQAASAVVSIHSARSFRLEDHPPLSDPSLRRFFEGPDGRLQPRDEESLGSGVLVSPEGYLLTNHHVIHSAEDIRVQFSDNRSTPAELVGSDPDTDLAVLRVDLVNLPQPVTFGNADRLRVGDVVLAIGNPFGVGLTVTQGIVSAIGRDRLGLSTYEDFIQTDAAINPGNSGGALINTQGDLVGINTAIFSQSGGSQGIGFAIPSNLAQSILTNLIQSGEVVRGWLGVQVQDLDAPLADSFDLTSAQGALVAGVVDDGPAAEAGLEPEDVITRIGDREITDVKDLLYVVGRQTPGDQVQVTAIRDGESITLAAQLSKRPSSAER